MTQIFSSKYFDLVRQREALQDRIDFVKRRELNGIVGEIVRMMRAYDISLDDLGAMLSRDERPDRRVRVAPKYMDPRTGKTWSGRGRRPVWLNGKNLEDYRLGVTSGSDAES
ncbi:H-NS histone family protein [Burkholderia seminalis]|uniref:H-NS histone family protein n=1 Tax=Burkholderia seminalis TaxID=488731 RepID=UPI00265586E2|nr:H-NS histone family protein [Burkholderia seminalis]MDN7592077.1 H-NS histone family protein [Burkholderia seminalis]